MVNGSPVQEAPGELEFVRAFVNTLDVEDGVDRLRDPASWEKWAARHDVGGSASSADLALARDVREGVRAGLVANHDRAPLPAAAVAALNAASDHARMQVRFDPTGATLTGTGAGVSAVFARVVASVAASIGDGRWSRLKVCVNDQCQWAFFDRSRSRTAQWCSMSICGNRAKQSRWRTVHEAGTD